MKVLFLIYLALQLACMVSINTGCTESHIEKGPDSTTLNVLIFSKTNAFRHESIEPGGEALKNYFTAQQMNTTHSEDSSLFNGNGIAGFDVIIFFNTTGNILDSVQQQSLVNHIKSGKGFVGIHSASDTEYDWPWYAGLVGAQFSNHPHIQQATIVKVDTSHIACKHLPDRWNRTDEWYNFKKIPSNVNVLLAIDETTYQGGEHDSIHPMSWNHEYDGGRSFYTALGHTVESYSDTLFLRHVYEGVKWAAGK